jgi:methionyl-tRNA formyltransferase
VIAGERETGVSIMRVVRELDAGPVFAEVRRPIPEDETSADVEQALAQVGAALCVRVVDDIAAGQASETPQDASRATYAHRLTKEEGAIDWTRSARELHNQIRGLHPWPHAHTFLAEERILVLRSAVQEDDGSAPAAPGTIVRAAGDDLVVAAGRGALRLTELRPEGKRAMSPREFMAGRHLKPGMRFASSPTDAP